MEKIRIGGAQIPCTNKLSRNVDILKKAIDWASNNNVDYLLTPEGALSGYFPWFANNNGITFDDIIVAEKEVVAYANKYSVGLILGTMWIENGSRENQQRFYSQEGIFLGKTNKTYIIPEHDQTEPNEFVDNIILKHNNNNISVLGLICNDFWGGPPNCKVALPLAADSLGSHLLLHSTNGFRGGDPWYDDFMNSWHDANLRMYSWTINAPIVTVDNCWYMQGEEYDGPTSSESGVLINGKWMTSVPRTGIQYFYYDFIIPRLFTYTYGKG